MNTVSPTKPFANAVDARIIEIDSQRSYDVGRRILILPEGQVKLTPTLGNVYRALLGNPGYALSNRQIIDEAYGKGYHIQEKAAQNRVNDFRRQVKHHTSWDAIKYIDGIGYMANIDFDDPKPDERVDLADDAYFDKRNGRVYREGYEYEQLATAQRAIFQYLLENPEHTFSRAKLMESVAKDFNKVAKPDTADVHITHIRAALKRLDLPATDIIETVRGQGYRFNSKARTLW
jgi:DNA-binding response OmpR family regulator